MLSCSDDAPAMLLTTAVDLNKEMQRSIDAASSSTSTPSLIDARPHSRMVARSPYSDGRMPSSPILAPNGLAAIHSSHFAYAGGASSVEVWPSLDKLSSAGGGVVKLPSPIRVTAPTLQRKDSLLQLSPWSARSVSSLSASPLSVSASRSQSNPLRRAATEALLHSSTTSTGHSQGLYGK